jgi:hypothetical protein
MIKLNTKASGKFTVYTKDEHGNLNVLAEAKNVITSDGLNAVGTNTWASLLQTGLLGSGSSTPNAADNGATMALSLISDALTPNGSPAMPSCYTLTDYDNVAGMVYRLGKSFQFTNNTGSDVVISELGVGFTRPTSTSDTTYKLFSRALADSPFTIKTGLFVYVMYELRLVTGVSTTRQTFQVQTDDPLNTSLSFPADTNLGTFANPYAFINSNGSISNNSLTAVGEGFFEPSNSQYYLYKMKTTPTPSLSGYYNIKRDWFEASATALSASNTAVGAAPGTMTVAHSLPDAYKFNNEDGGTYVTDSFKRARHIIIPPETPSVPESLYGFSISNKDVAKIATVHTNGYHIVFPGLSSAWIKPKNYFMKFYMEQTWSYES